MTTLPDRKQLDSGVKTFQYCNVVWKKGGVDKRCQAFKKGLIDADGWILPRQDMEQSIKTFQVASRKKTSTRKRSHEKSQNGGDFLGGQLSKRTKILDFRRKAEESKQRVFVLHTQLGMHKKVGDSTKQNIREANKLILILKEEKKEKKKIAPIFAQVLSQNKILVEEWERKKAEVCALEREISDQVLDLTSVFSQIRITEPDFPEMEICE
jgi:hypothetical protein